MPELEEAILAGIPVILLPGGVMPAEFAYAELVAELGPDVDARPKELEVYATEQPSENYGLETEVEGILRHAEACGFDKFHLVGYSGGGASSLAFTSRHPDRLLSLCLNEPAWGGNAGLSENEQDRWKVFAEVARLPDDKMMPAFVAAQLRGGVDLPPPPDGPPPPWMAKRPAGIKALTRAFKAFDLDIEALRGFDRPVLFTLGSLSHPNYYEEIATRLEGIFPKFRVEVYKGRHHFDPPHRVEVPRFAAMLKEFWSTA